ncbi:MAG: hypothetical protein CVV41_21080 [Candidatus Riflebacteria bacterium HGW-Riflebacteria-1]|jgi:hypothetical protein|nr:MAG: hypothetical protein CVV41_21080 [Candidatus Riflebacteria bacterium HGW-Riflebacteria-1]
MLSIALLVSYIIVVQQHSARFYEENLLAISLEVFCLMFAMAVGLYHMRAESCGKTGLLALAASASSEDRDEFVHKFNAARESLFGAGLFFCFMLILILSLAGNMSKLGHYQLTVLMPIPIIATLLLEAILKLALRLKAGIRADLPFEGDFWLSWLGLAILGFFAVIWACPYDESDAGFLIFLTLPVAGIVSGVLWFIRRQRKSAERGRSE